MFGPELVDAIRRGEVEPPAGIVTLGLDRTHEWITDLSPGRVRMVWEADSAYANLEGATFCTWLAALADQAVFFATNTLCTDGESTRMRSFRLDCHDNLTGGVLVLEAQVAERDGDELDAVCQLSTGDGAPIATFTATVGVIRS